MSDLLLIFLLEGLIIFLQLFDLSVLFGGLKFRGSVRAREGFSQVVIVGLLDLEEEATEMLVTLDDIIEGLRESLEFHILVI